MEDTMRYFYLFKRQESQDWVVNGVTESIRQGINTATWCKPAADVLVMHRATRKSHSAFDTSGQIFHFVDMSSRQRRSRATKAPFRVNIYPGCDHWSARTWIKRRCSVLTTCSGHRFLLELINSQLGVTFLPRRHQTLGSVLKQRQTNSPQTQRYSLQTRLNNVMDVSVMVNTFSSWRSHKSG